MNLSQFKNACWAVYFYRKQYYLMQCGSYREANQFVNSLLEKPAVDPLGVYCREQDAFHWELRDGFDLASVQAMH